ncbi:MAG: DUF2976 domain-containing protein [Gammaproteobacteria bacterium]|nr:DUF2976 domain-containing protein [Gammaproteobacteria bacterium]
MKKQISLLITVASAYLLSGLNLLQAALPTAAGVSTGAGITSTTSPIQFIRELRTTGVGTAAVGVAAVSTIGVGWAVYSAFSEARQKGEWTKFGVTASVGLAVIVGVILLAILAADYAS